MSVAAETTAAPRRRLALIGSAEAVAFLLLAAALLRPQIAGSFDSLAVRNWSAFFVAITLQASFSTRAAASPLCWQRSIPAGVVLELVRTLTGASGSADRPPL